MRRLALLGLACVASALRTVPRRLSLSAAGEAGQPVARRRALGGLGAAVATAWAPVRGWCEATPPSSDPETITLKSGLKYQDFKVGAGSAPSKGQRVTIDYVMQTSGARYGSKIYSTKEAEQPFSFILGDPAVIMGLNEAVSGMRAGGVRRVYVPADLGYTSVGAEKQQPIPPPQEFFGEYQRWKNIYANPRRPYQPELILDVKLFGRK